MRTDTYSAMLDTGGMELMTAVDILFLFKVSCACGAALLKTAAGGVLHRPIDR